jgi:hypothetical protein
VSPASNPPTASSAEVVEEAGGGTEPVGTEPEGEPEAAPAPAEMVDENPTLAYADLVAAAGKVRSVLNASGQVIDIITEFPEKSGKCWLIYVPVLADGKTVVKVWDGKPTLTVAEMKDYTAALLADADGRDRTR